MPILREAFCDLTVQLLDKYNISTEGDTVVEFSDTQTPNVLSLASMGITEGFGDGIFGPGEDITREQAAIILFKTAKCLNYKAKDGTVDNVEYADFSEISD